MNYKRLLNITLVIILSSYVYSSEIVSIAGVVIDSKGKPVKKADVELLTAKKEKVAESKTAKDGTFNIKDIKAQNYYLNITSKKKGGASVVIKAWTSGNIDIKDLKVKLSEKGAKQKSSFGPKPSLSDNNIGAPPDLKKGGALAGRTTKKPPKKVEKVSLSGKVLNKKGKPVKKAKVILIDENYNAVEEIETNKEGLFSIEKLKPADYNLTISKKKMLVSLNSNHGLKITKVLIILMLL